MKIATETNENRPLRIRYEMASNDQFHNKAEQLIGLHRLFDWMKRLSKRLDYSLIDFPMSGVRIHFNQSQYFGLAVDEQGFMFVANANYGSWMSTAPIKSATLHHHAHILSLITSNLETLPDKGVDSFCIQFECAPDFVEALRNSQTLGFAVINQENSIERLNRIVALYHDTGIGLPI